MKSDPSETRESERERGTLLPRHHRSTLQNLFDGRNRRLNFFIRVVEVRRHANPSFRPPIHQNLALQQLLADFVRVGHIDRDRSAALLWIARRIHPPTMLVRQGDQLRRLPFRLLSNSRYAD